MTDRDPSLHERRMLAAERSLGRSADYILQTVMRVVAELDARGDVLDFGAGRGDLVRRLAGTRRFNTLTAVDLQPPLDPDPPIRWLAADLNQPLAVSEESFDLVVSSEVIEHLENPRAVAREWYRLLRPGGWVVFTTPNNESLRSLLALFVRGHYVDFGDRSYPAHITAVLRLDAERFLLEAGFDQLSHRYTEQGALPGFTRLSWQRISGGRLSGVRFSDNLVVLARKPRQTSLNR